MENIPIRTINKRPQEPFFSENFRIRNLSDLLAGEDMIHDLHRHDFFFLLILEKGKGEHVIDFVSYPVKDHSVFFIRPGQVHQLKLKKGSTGFLMEFSRDFYLARDQAANQIIRKAGSKNFSPFDSRSFKKVLSVLTFIFEEYSNKQERYNESIKAGLNIFFIELIRQTKASHSASDHKNLYDQERLEELWELLGTHIATSKQVAQYADMLHLSPYQLNAITKSMLGKTCSELINDHIILEAKKYLLATSNQINQIAYHLGYDDVSYFIRFFKKHTGYSPEMFRHNFK